MRRMFVLLGVTGALFGCLDRAFAADVPIEMLEAFYTGCVDAVGDNQRARNFCECTAREIGARMSAQDFLDY